MWVGGLEWEPARKGGGRVCAHAELSVRVCEPRSARLLLRGVASQ